MAPMALMTYFIHITYSFEAQINLILDQMDQMDHVSVEPFVNQTLFGQEEFHQCLCWHHIEGFPAPPPRFGFNQLKRGHHIAIRHIFPISFHQTYVHNESQR